MEQWILFRKALAWVHFCSMGLRSGEYEVRYSKISRASSSISIFVAGLLHVILGSGVLSQHTTLATPTQNRATTSAIVRPSFSRTDKTLRRKSDEHVIRLVYSIYNGLAILSKVVAQKYCFCHLTRPTPTPILSKTTSAISKKSKNTMRTNHLIASLPRISNYKFSYKQGSILIL